MRRSEAADLDAHDGVWAEDEEIVCVHPGGPGLQVRTGARQLGGDFRLGSSGSSGIFPIRWCFRA